MQLEHLEVTLAGTNRPLALGPLFSGLNAISGPKGSGKTRLLQWLRQTLSEHVSAHGFSVPYDQNGRSTRTSIQSSSHGILRIRSGGSPYRLTGDGLAYGTDHRVVANAVSPRQRQAFDLLCSDKQATETQAHLEEIARRLGLDTTTMNLDSQSRDQLVARERELVAQLQRVEHLPVQRDELLSRRRDIEHRLNQLRQSGSYPPASVEYDRQRLVDRYSAIEADLRGAENELQQYDRQIAEAKAELRLAEIDHSAAVVDSSFRQQLQQLDDRLASWRRTLRDIKLHRETIEHQQTELLLDQQTGTQLSATLRADARASMRSLEAQLHDARKQLDQFVVHYAADYARSGDSANGSVVTQHQVIRDATGRTHLVHQAQPAYHSAPAALPEVLRAMQRELHQLCHQLSRQELDSASETLKQQAAQLRRCEVELLQSVEQLIEQRSQLLRKIADKYQLSSDQLSLAFGQWCQCHDHRHLADWLLQDESTVCTIKLPQTDSRPQVLDRIARLEAERKQAALRAEECRRQMRDADQSRAPRTASATDSGRQIEESQLLRELDLLVAALSDWDGRDRLQADLDEVRRRLAQLPSGVTRPSSYQQATDRHLIGLCGQDHYAPHRSSDSFGSRSVSSIADGFDQDSDFGWRREVPDAIVRVAQRLAIAEALAGRGDSIPLLLDQAFDEVGIELQRTAVDHLARVGQRQQIVILTDKAHVAELVTQHRGRVFYLSAEQPAGAPEPDINRWLTAYANDEESDKWQHSAHDVVEEDHRAQAFYLHQSSPLEALPAMNDQIAARCRAAGIYRIGHLLDADAAWLANNLRMAQVSPSTVRNWQAMAELLCSVRNLRPFDARVLVGSGVRSASQLSHMHPSNLLENVERFLTTDYGRRILRSGNRYELSRINAWIAAAKRSTSRRGHHGHFDADIREPWSRWDARHDDSTSVGDRRYSREQHMGSPSTPHFSTEHYGYGETELMDGQEHSGNGRAGEQEAHRSERPARQQRTFPSLADSSGQPVKSQRPRAQRTSDSNGHASRKFYLELSSPVVDAPSIGERMAQRLQQHNIVTVQHLLSADADRLAKQLGHRRVTADTVRAWQQQATLVCRIPNLRGHDAQLLVACSITSPEALAGLTAESLLTQVLGFARTSEGQRVLRGSKEPDLAEVNDWISWASQCRNLSAA
ncbi:MAG: DUF4332 domain-containing protein [Pirellulaceae bacterium]|nr:DUF4332 domain-containing protein [Pirellulaceae bacterium]